MTLRQDLTRLASNYLWTWNRSTRGLLDDLPGAGPGRHPIETIASLDDEALSRLESDPAFAAEVRMAVADLDQMESAGSPRIAYCSPEFGLSDHLPLYAGGLGVLSGDHLKAAGDLGLPLGAIGLFYREGVYRQTIENGRQAHHFSPIDPEMVGAVDTDILVDVPFPGRDVFARVWKIVVGGVPLLLLDTDVAPNSESDRRITDRLYVGDQQHRIDQEMILGIGGARAMSALGWDVAVHHLNEGHAGFIVLELIDRVVNGGEIAAAVETVRRGVVFTTHTPVPAGIDRLDRRFLMPYFERWAARWGIDVSSLWALGEDPDDPSLFNMAIFCLRTSGAANGVSELHGEVSRSLFRAVPEGSRISHVTNGVHARTWAAAPVQDLFDVHLGPTWSDGDPVAWEGVHSIGDEQIEEVRRASKRGLAGLLEASGTRLDPDALVIGFARRFAPYKRASLLLSDHERLVSLLGDDDRPIHFVYAGKSHPDNREGLDLVAQVVAFSRSSEANGRFSFLTDYDMAVASQLVAGADIWLNNPVRGREASGTSGEKSALNGGLNCSILDGWWAEMYDGENGWAIPTSSSEDEPTRDGEEAVATIDALLAARDEYFGDRSRFYRRIRHAWATLGPKVTASRMVTEYDEGFYQPAMRGVPTGVR